MREAEDWSATLSFRAAIVAYEEGDALAPVQTFRDRWLSGGLLSPTLRGVSRWVEQRRLEAEKSAERPLESASERLGLGEFADRMRGVYKLTTTGKGPDFDDPVAFLRIEVVQLGIGEIRRRFDVEVASAPHLALGELFWLGLYLQERFGWSPASARGWAIAADTIPWTNAVEFETSAPPTPRPPLLYRHRVVVDASLDFPVNRLAKILAEIQDSDDRNSPYPPIARPIERAILEATYFAVTRNDGGAWQDVLEDWNESVPEKSWRYVAGQEGARRLAKDVRRTYRALLGKPLDWKRGPGKPRED